VLHDLQGLGSLTTIWRHLSEAWDTELQDKKKDPGTLPYILMYGKLLKGFSAVPISADKLTNAQRAEIIEDDLKDDGFIEQIAQAYARVPDTDLDKLEVSLPKPISISRVLGTVSTLRTFAE
jgi:hypothetical protein